MITKRELRIGLAVNRSYTFYREALQGVRRYAETQPDWCLVSLSLEQDPSMTLRRVRPDGMVATILSSKVARVLGRWRLPLVTVSNVLPTPKCCARVFVDNKETGRVAAQHFLDRNIRHFGFVGPSHHVYSAQMRDAYRYWLERAGFEVREYLTSPSIAFDPSGCQWALDSRVITWLKSLPKPIGVFTPADEWGTQLLEACRQVKLRVPEDVAVLGVEDDDFECNLARPKLSSIALPAEQIGYRAAQLLGQMLTGVAAPGEPVYLPPLGVSSRRSTDTIAVDDGEIVAAVRFIRSNIHRPLRVADVLREVPIGRRTLERRCIAAIGRGIGAEIRRARLERARWLLANTSEPMKAVARHSGFTEYRQLAIAINDNEGVSPTEYRRKTRGECDP